MPQNTNIERKLEELRDKASRAKGRLEQVMATLKKEFQVSTIEEAEALLEKTKKELDRMERKCDNDFSEFESKWGIKLGEMG